MDKQRTVKKEVAFEGVGLHSGQHTKVVIEPAEADKGISFLFNGKLLPLAEGEIVRDDRRSILRWGKEEISTVEHLLASLAGLEVDNAILRLSAPEPPALDGSAKEFVEGIKKSGIIELNALRKTLFISRPEIIKGKGNFILALPSQNFRISYILDYVHPMVGKQFLDWYFSVESFCNEIAPARTFALEEELEAIFTAGYAKGGSLDNAVVVYKDRYSSPLRFSDEFVRHKILDLIGDLALVGCSVRGHFIVYRGGHRLNQGLVNKLRKMLS